MCCSKNKENKQDTKHICSCGETKHGLAKMCDRCRRKRNRESKIDRQYQEYLKRRGDGLSHRHSHVRGADAYHCFEGLNMETAQYDTN